MTDPLIPQDQDVCIVYVRDRYSPFCTLAVYKQDVNHYTAMLAGIELLPRARRDVIPLCVITRDEAASLTCATYYLSPSGKELMAKMLSDFSYLREDGAMPYRYPRCPKKGACIDSLVSCSRIIRRRPNV
jgi:hypothetical protein